MNVICTPIQSDAHWHALRADVVGASEAPALLGVHEYLTYFQLWARKRGLLPPIDDTEVMKRGRRLEPVAVEVIREDFPAWEVMVPRQHFADRDCGLGCTPDLFVRDPDQGEGVVQIKSVAPAVFRRSWCGDSDLVQPPIWIVVQAMLEAHLTGRAWAAVAALVVDHTIQLHLVPVPIRQDVVDRVKAEALAFWNSVIEGRAPDPDYRRDAEVIRELLKQDDGSEVDLTADNELPALLAERESALQLMKAGEMRADAINAELLHRLGAAKLGRFNGGYISAKTVHRKGYEVKPATYRQLRVVKKEDAA